MKSFDCEPIKPSGRFAGKNVIGVDTETTLIPSQVLSLNGKSRVEPIPVTDLVVGSLAYSGLYQYQAAARDEFLGVLQHLLENPQNSFVFHNAAFDVAVIDKASPAVGVLLRQAAAEGRVFDTMNRELLIQIAQGRQTFATRQLRIPTLQSLAARRAGINLNKDEDVRCGFAAFVGRPESEIPEAYLKYAGLDAYATLAVFASQEPLMAHLAADARLCPYPIAPDAEARWGLLSEHIQLRGALALAWLEDFPIRIDLDVVGALHQRFDGEYQALQQRLVDYGWAYRTKKAQEWHLRQKIVRTVLTGYARERGLVPPITNSGLMTLEADYWADVLPRIPPGKIDDSTLEGKIQVWLRATKIQKIISTYLDCYGISRVHFTHYWNLVARTTRTSSVRPNVQNVPKHRESLRSMFIPTPGYRYYEFDFKAAELAALAQIHVSMFGSSVLADDINAGLDPHVETAKRIYGAEAFEAAAPDRKKKLRQLAKALNFGFPGGLGPRKFVLYAGRGFGVKLTLDEARQLRAQFLEANPQLGRYLEDHLDTDNVIRLAAENLGLSQGALLEALDGGRGDVLQGSEVHVGLALNRLRAWCRGDRTIHIPAPPDFSPMFDLFRSTTASLAGTVRGKASYTEAHNFPFQNLVACALKLGLWALYQEWLRSDGTSWRPVVEVHDSVLIEVREGSDHVVPLLAELFRNGLQTLLPDVKAGVDIEGPKSNWGKQ